VVVGLASEVVYWALGRFAHLTFERNRTLPALMVFMAGGFLGGLHWARRGRGLESIASRGSVVREGEGAQRATRKHLARARRASPSRRFMTVAGLAVPFEDDTLVNSVTAKGGLLRRCDLRLYRAREVFRKRYLRGGVIAANHE
jgi:hypothetical protein